MTTVDWITIAVAIVGAITGTLGLALSILNFRRDRAELKMIVESGWMGSGGDDWKGPYLFVKAVNVGRRAVTVKSGGVLLSHHQDRLMIMPGPPGSPTSLPKTISEAEDHQLWTHYDGLIEQSAKGEALPTHGYFDDSTGRRWTGRVPPKISDDIADRVLAARQ